jgi:SNF2 family DNA or RNA helicase
MTIKTITQLMPHQQAAIAKLLPSKVGALFADLGTGKSLMAIKLAEIRQQKYDRVFWFCPVSLKETIRQEWRKHTDVQEDDIKVWDDKVADDNLPTSATIHILGIESMSSSARVILAYHKMVTERSFVIVDESSYIKGHHSHRTERITALSSIARYRLILTGTPFTQGVVDLFAQMSFLSNKILGYSSFYSFAANHLEYEVRVNEQGYKYRTGRIVRAHNTDYLAAKIAPYVYQVSKDECLDLPDKLYETRYFCMTDEQREYYQQAKREILLDLEYDDWSSIAIFHLFSSLQAIVCGYWKRTVPKTLEKQQITFHHRRIGLLMDTIASIPDTEQVIIWSKYHYAIDEMKAAIEKHYGASAYSEFHGGIPEQKRNEQLAQWKSGGTRLLIATQSAGSHGLTLNNAAYSVFYADSYKYSERRQAEDRNHRIGQERRPTYISLCCEASIDERIATALERKENALEVFQARINHYRKDALKDMAMRLVREL